MYRLSIVMLMTAALSSQAAGAQEMPDATQLVPGTRVRVEAQGRTAIGGVRYLAADTLAITL